MIHLNLSKTSQILSGKLLGEDGEFHGVSTDTRGLKAGELFFCLKGNLDGHDFIGDAVTRGASAMVIDKAHQELSSRFVGSQFIIVEDTLKALGDLAQFWRQKFKIPVIAITGSNGKTTTKDLCYAVLSTTYSCLATRGNFNNLIGLPLTLFRLDSSCQVALVEIGMNDYGEIARLSEIAAPSIGLITNVGPAHLEKLRDLQGVASAKGELFQYLSSDDVAIVNQDDPYVAVLPTRASKITFGRKTSAKIYGRKAFYEGEDLWIQGRFFEEEFSLKMKLSGKHNLYNVLATLGVAASLKIPLKKALLGLKNCSGHSRRMEKIFLSSDFILLDDCYNANPMSMEVALDTLCEIKEGRQTVAILGEMFELGEFAEQGHRLVGEKVAMKKIDYLISIGPHCQDVAKSATSNGMRKERVFAKASVEDALDEIKKLFCPSKIFLIKGSRGMHLERVVDFVKEHLRK